MAPQHIEFNEVDEQQPLEVALQPAQRGGHTVAVGLGMIALRQSAAREEVFDLANANHLFTVVFQDIQKGSSQWCEREVAPVFGALEVARRAGERTGDDAANGVFSGKLGSGDAAHMIQFLERYDILVRGDLKNAVCRSIQNGLASAHVLFTQLLDDLGA